MKKIKTLHFKSILNEDTGYVNRYLGYFDQEMTLYKGNYDSREDIWHYEIEWYIEEADRVAHIGLSVQKGRLIDYDGVFELPKQAVKLLRSVKIVVPRDMVPTEPKSKKEVWIVKYMNKDKNFQLDKKRFNSLKKAEAWARKNLESYSPDFIERVE